MEMVRLTGNGKLAEMIESLLHQLVRPLISGRYPSFSEYAANVREAGGSLTPGHRAIVAALLERDAKKAKKLLKEDIYPSQY